MGEGIPLKKDKSRWERGALMARIVAKEKNGENLFLFVYFDLRFSIYATT